jgi:LEA14-like dessication related protein
VTRQWYGKSWGERALRGITVVLAATLLAACATAPRLEPPTVAVTGVIVERVGQGNAQFTLVLAMANPNDRDIDVEGVAAELRVEDVVVGSARLMQPVRLPARGDTTANLAVRTDLSPTLQAAAELARRLIVNPGSPPGVRYSVSGTATIDGGRVVPFSRSGEIALR